MEDLLKPDYGVMILTICNFLLLVYLLKRFAWNGLIGALEKREAKIKSDVEQAAKDRQAAENLKSELDEKLAQISAEASKKMAEAVALGKAQSAELLAQTQAQTKRMFEQTKAQLEAEKNQALADVRDEIVRTAILAAEKIAHEQISAQAADQAVERVLTEIEKK